MDISPTDLYTGTQVNYYFICPAKIWLFSHRITMEQSSDLVGIGEFIHETSYARERKDVIVDNRIGIDLIKRNNGITIHEVKKSKKPEKGTPVPVILLKISKYPTSDRKCFPSADRINSQRTLRLLD